MICILNRHDNFEKGVNKILKLVCSRLDIDSKELGLFVSKTFSGFLTHTNLISLATFLAKQHRLARTNQARDHYWDLTSALNQERFFWRHLSQSRLEVIDKFFAAVSHMVKEHN